MEIAHPNSLVLKPFPNGITVSLGKIAEKIEFSLKAVGVDFDAIVVLLDRERRALPAADIAVELQQRLAELCPGRSFVIGVSDIQVENWILADVDRMRARFGNEAYIYAGDGVGGKRRLGELSGGESFSPRAKAELLKSCKASSIRASSASFDRFCGAANFEWFWLAA
ncbi:hypothetical protein [Brevundimonas sp. Leaf363]|uniref:hypothetical protein n=1 Tax=Brevundimonas sp. Leaf363 TaxID=1736353 RepID=UPI0012E1EC72|nr:hypothetical protein [Brevundimonas sp. Leaf363]